MPRFFSEVDFTQIQSKNFVAEGSPTPPVADVDAVVGQLWNDTSIANNAVMKYWDGNEWVRMDGGGDIPNGMIVNRHIADDANIAWTKIDVPTDLATTGDVTASLDQLRDDFEAADAAITTAYTAADAAINTRIDNLAGELTGDYVTLDTDQTIAGVKTFSASPIVPAGDAPTEAVNFGQLTALQATVTGVTDGLDTRLDAVESVVQDVNNATQAELDALSGRVTTAEGEIDALQAADTASDAALQAEIDRATAEEADIRADFAAADTGLGQQITDETAARTQGDQTNATAITAETTRATTAEGALGTRIDGVEGDLADEVTARDAAILVETNRATAAEDLLDGRLDTLEAVDNLTQAEFDTFNTANTAALALKADLVDGKVPLSQLPSVRTDDVYVVAWDDLDPTPADADEALATVTGADEGDVAVINGGPGGAFINTGTGWVPLSSGASGATDAEVQAAVAAEAALRAAADADLQSAIDALEAVDYATQAELDAVETALENADTALGVRIDTEHQHHLDATAASDAALATEVTARTTADTALQGAIDDEAAARALEDTALSGRITTEVSDRTAADTSIRTDFATADGVNAAAISAEVTRATAAEGVLQDNINDEADARTAADTALRTDLDAAEDAIAAEVARATGVESGHNTRITTLENAGAQAGADLTALTNRVTAAEGVNTAQDGRLDALETHDSGEAARIAAAVATETAAREAADTAATDALAAEAAARVAGDATNASAITAEATTARAAEGALGLRIDGVETSIVTQIAAEAAARSAADTDVRSEFAAADALLQTDINTRALDANVVHKAGAEEITGVKTFTVNPQVPGGVGETDAVNFGQLDDYVSSNAYDDTALAGRVTAVEGEVDVLNGAAGDAGSVATTADARIAAARGVSVASLVDGKIPLGELPALALTNVTVFDDIAARDAATGMDEGDVAVVADSDGDGTRQTFIYDGDNWVPLSSPADVTEQELAAAVAAGLAALVAGDGLTRTGDTFNVVGTAGRVTVTADAVDIAADYVGQASITTVGTLTSGALGTGFTTVGLAQGGTGYAATDLDDLVDHLGITMDAPALYAETLTAMVSGTPFTVTHNLGGEDVVTSLRQINGDRAGEVVFADVKVTGPNTITVTVDPSHDEAIDLRVVVIGGAVDETGRIVGRIVGRRD